MWEKHQILGKMVGGHWKCTERFTLGENLGRTHWRRTLGPSCKERLQKIVLYHIHASYAYELLYYLLA